MDKTQILKEIKLHYKFRSDADFARHLGITPQNLNHWYLRNTYDVTVLAIKFPDIDPAWIMTGEGEMLKKPEPVKIPADDPDIISMPKSVWKVIEDQAASLRAKDEQINEVITLLKEEIKK